MTLDNVFSIAAIAIFVYHLFHPNGH